PTLTPRGLLELVEAVHREVVPADLQLVGVWQGERLEERKGCTRQVIWDGSHTCSTGTQSWPARRAMKNCLACSRTSVMVTGSPGCGVGGAASAAGRRTADGHVAIGLTCHHTAGWKVHGKAERRSPIPVPESLLGR